MYTFIYMCVYFCVYKFSLLSYDHTYSELLHCSISLSMKTFKHLGFYTYMISMLHRKIEIWKFISPMLTCCTENSIVIFHNSLQRGQITESYQILKRNVKIHRKAAVSKMYWRYQAISRVMIQSFNFQITDEAHVNSEQFKTSFF